MLCLPLSARAVIDAIDVEAQRTLANKLQETLHAEQAAGLGSGSGQKVLLQWEHDILSQANRDKMRIVNDSALERTRLAIALGTLALAVVIVGIGLGLLLLAPDAAMRGHGVTLVIVATVLIAGVSSPLVTRLLKG